MRTLLILLVAMAATLVGCGRPELGMKYTILVDPSLTLDYQEAVVTAGYAWSDKIPGLELDYVVAACGALDSLPARVICFHSGSGSPVDSDSHSIDGTTHVDLGLLSAMDRAEVILYPSNIVAAGAIVGPDALVNTTMHELGHALAHRYGHIPQGLMSPMLSFEPAVITDADVDYFWSNR